MDLIFRWRVVSESKGKHALHRGAVGEVRASSRRLENVPICLVTAATGAWNKPFLMQKHTAAPVCVRTHTEVSTYSFIYRLPQLLCVYFTFLSMAWCMTCDALLWSLLWFWLQVLESRARWGHPSEGFDLHPAGSLPLLRAAWCCTEPEHHLPASGLLCCFHTHRALLKNRK